MGTGGGLGTINPDRYVNGSAAVAIPASDAGTARIAVLDGWRAISILLVLAGHMLPLGPKSWGMNSPVAALGMEIFFNLSGFLIVSILLRDQNIPKFLIRRATRIIPLAWLTLGVVFLVYQPGWTAVQANFLFYANLPPFSLEYTGHFWSLCVEIQFYVFIALSVLFFGRRALFLVPVAALMVTGWRIYSGVTISVITLWRVDEILAGGILALIVNHPPAARVRQFIRKIPWPVVLLLFLLSTYDLFTPLDYARPYIGALLIGISILNPPLFARRVLENAKLAYVARISYALYVIHPYTMSGWLGEGPPIVKYAKRIISFALSFAFANVSTFYYEKAFVTWAHRVTARSKQSLDLRSIKADI